MSDFQGWISIHRKFIDSPIYTDSQAVHLWLHLLISANHKDNTFTQNGKLITVKRGQLLTGRQRLSDATKLSESKVQRLLELFVSLEMIEQQTNSKNRLISITNYDSYQSTEQQMNNKRTANEQQLNTNNNDYNVNNDNNLLAQDAKALAETSKPIEKRKPKEKIGYSVDDLVSIGVDSQIAKDFMSVRKKAFTQSQLEFMKQEADAVGLPVQQIIKLCAQKGWAGFQRGYVKRNDSEFISFYEMATGKKPQWDWV